MGTFQAIHHFSLFLEEAPEQQRQRPPPPPPPHATVNKCLRFREKKKKEAHLGLMKRRRCFRKTLFGDEYFMGVGVKQSGGLQHLKDSERRRDGEKCHVTVVLMDRVSQLTPVFCLFRLFFSSSNFFLTDYRLHCKMGFPKYFHVAE